MADSTRPADKATLLAVIQTSYKQFDVLLVTLCAEQMTIPGVNGSGSRSVKDTLAHLAAWQNHQAAQQARDEVFRDEDEEGVVFVFSVMPTNIYAYAEGDPFSHTRHQF